MEQQNKLILNMILKHKMNYPLVLKNYYLLLNYIIEKKRCTVLVVMSVAVLQKAVLQTEVRILLRKQIRNILQKKKCVFLKLVLNLLVIDRLFHKLVCEMLQSSKIQYLGGHQFILEMEVVRTRLGHNLM